MAAFAYILIVQDKTQITEVDGVILHSNINSARKALEDAGYVVREIRPAKQEEISIQKLRNLRSKLSGPVQKAPPPVIVPDRKPWFRAEYALVLLVVVLVILYVVFGDIK